MNYFNDLLSIPRGMQSLETDAQQLWRCWCFRRWMSANKTYEVNENTAVARGVSLSLLLLLLFCCWATTRTENVVLLIEKAYNATQYFKRQNTIFLVVRYKLVKNWYVRLGVVSYTRGRERHMTWPLCSASVMGTVKMSRFKGATIGVGHRTLLKFVSGFYFLFFILNGCGQIQSNRK